MEKDTVWRLSIVAILVLVVGVAIAGIVKGGDPSDKYGYIKDPVAKACDVKAKDLEVVEFNDPRQTGMKIEGYFSYGDPIYAPATVSLRDKDGGMYGAELRFMANGTKLSSPENIDCADTNKSDPTICASNVMTKADMVRQDIQYNGHTRASAEELNHVDLLTPKEARVYNDFWASNTDPSIFFDKSALYSDMLARCRAA